VIERFDKNSLADFIVKALGLRSGDDVEIQRDGLDPKRLMIVRHPQEADLK
jgi:hypothetical protein